MSIWQKIGKSVVKGGKYAGLVVAAEAVRGAAGVFEPSGLADIFSVAGVPEVIAVAAGGYVSPFVVGVLVVTVQQLLKHAKKVKEAPVE